VTEGDKCRTFMTTMKIHHMGNYSIYWVNFLINTLYHKGTE
jgi:hypothetical protein